jgi:3-hydroxybutyryl-CoA dehydrogenase
MEIKKVGVVSCGQMGGGITQVAAQAGFQVTVSARTDGSLKKGLGVVNANLTRNVEKGRMTQQEKDAVWSRIHGTTNRGDFKDCDLVIEAAVEDMAEKIEIFKELEKICRKDAILATNTSCLSIIDMAIVTTRKEKVIGLHFFNPVPVMKLLEIVKTVATSKDTLETGIAFGKAVGKTVVIAQDSPGFIVNRLMIPQLLNAIRMYESGIATREDIDTAMQIGLNHPMGPLTLSDLIGLDVVNFIAGAIYNEFKDPQYVSPTLLVKMVKAGWLGRKTGKGFYDYTAKT